MDGIRCAEHCDSTGQANLFRSCSGRRKDYGGRRVEKLTTVMLTDSEDVETYLIGKLDLLSKSRIR